MLWSLVHQAHQGQPMGIKIGSCTLCLWTLELNRAGMLQWSTLLFENSLKIFLSIFSSKCPRGQWINCISRSVTIIVFVLSQYFEFWICIQILEMRCQLLKPTCGLEWIILRFFIAKVTILIAQCKTVATPLPMYWSYQSCVEPSIRDVHGSDFSKPFCIHVCVFRSSSGCYRASSCMVTQALASLWYWRPYWTPNRWAATLTLVLKQHSARK